MTALRILVILLTCSLMPSGAQAEAFSCAGRVPNPVTDIAWLSIFPIKIGPTTVASFGQEDIGTNPPAICACPLPFPPYVRIGLGISFWEPARAAEVSTTPFCSPMLGGAILGADGGLIKRGAAKTETKQRNSFYHIHWFLFPLTNWMSIFSSLTCLQLESFDIAMLSEFEPTWQDDELAMITSPEAALFTNPVAQAACAADCVAASVGFPLTELFWCDGCQGPLYPLSGNVANHESGVQASLLNVFRMHSLLHRVGVAFNMNSEATMCLPLPWPIINKRSYKTQMMYPIPNIEGAHPYGRSEALWSAGKEYPALGEDFSYLIWRRRLCCAL